MWPVPWTTPTSWTVVEPMAEPMRGTLTVNDRWSARRHAWAYLSRVIEGPSAPLRQLLAEGRDVEAIAHGVKRREPWIGSLLGQTAARYRTDSAAHDLLTADRNGTRLITPDDDEWPSDPLDRAFGFADAARDHVGRSGGRDAVAPHALWVRGGSPAELTQRAVAVVGTRSITRYGWEVTRMLVEGLAASRWTIVSGGALGVDTVAHETALANGTPTIAVAACGPGRTYPARNAALFDRIAGDGARGAVISEYPPGVHPARHRFLTRNRLVAALSGGTVVVEAAWRSGALNTLTWAARLGTVAMAVPGPVTGHGSLGCHERIRNGEAQLVTTAGEIRELIEPLGTVDVRAQYEFAFPADRVQALSHTELRVFDATSTESRITEMVAAEAGITVPLTVHILVDLQQKGLVQRDGRSWRRTG